MPNLQRLKSDDVGVGCGLTKLAKTPSRSVLAHGMSKGYRIRGLLGTFTHPIAGLMPPLLLSASLLSLRCLIYVVALGSQCSVPLGDGSATENEPYWLEKMKHQGLSAYNKDPASYRTFRNVKDFGAMGDGITDDTQAILSVYIFIDVYVVTDGIH